MEAVCIEMDGSEELRKHLQFVAYSEQEEYGEPVNVLLRLNYYRDPRTDLYYYYCPGTGHFWGAYESLYWAASFATCHKNKIDPDPAHLRPGLVTGAGLVEHDQPATWVIVNREMTICCHKERAGISEPQLFGSWFDAMDEVRWSMTAREDAGMDPEWECPIPTEHLVE